MISKLKPKFRMNTGIVLSGGLGNQLFMLFAGLHISLNQGEKLRVYKPEFSKAYGIHGSSIAKFELSKYLIYAKEPFKVKFKYRILAIFRRKFPKLSENLVQYFPYYESPVLGFDTKFSGLRKGALIKGYFQTYYYFQSFLEKNPDFKLELKETSVNFRSYENLIASKSFTVIHLRFGDYLLHSNSIGILAREYYVEAIRKLNSENSNFVVFSDDISRAQTRIKDLLPRETTWIGSEDLSAEETLILMSKGKYFIIGNSTFGYWGAMLSKDPECVIAPSSWFKNEVSPYLLFPKDWRLVEPVWEK